MKISIISASHRKNSQSKKVSTFLKNNLLNINSELVPFFLDLAETALPLWSPEKKMVKIFGKPWKSISYNLDKSDGFILVVLPDMDNGPPAARIFYYVEVGSLHINLV